MKEVEKLIGRDTHRRVRRQMGNRAISDRYRTQVLADTDKLVENGCIPRGGRTDTGRRLAAEGVIHGPVCADDVTPEDR